MTADFGSDRVDLAKEADFRLGEILVRPSTRQVESGGVPETLEPRIMQVLVALARRRGEVVSRDELIETCWEGRVVGDDALHRCTYRIRKLGETHKAFRLETIPRVGYRLWVEEAVVGAEAAAQVSTKASPEHASRTDPAAPAAPSRPLLARHGVLLAAAVALVAVAAFAWFALPKDTPSDRVAFFGFTASEDDPALRDIATRATDEAYVDFGIRRVDTVARGEAVVPSGMSRLDRAADLRARFAMSGEVRRDGDNAVFAMRIEDTGSRATLWDATINGPAARPVPIAFRAADVSTDIASCIVTTVHTDDASPRDAQALAVVATGCGVMWRRGLPGAVQVYRELVEKKIGGPDADGALVAYLALTLGAAPPAARASVVDEAEQALARASRNAPDSFTTAGARARLAIVTGAPPAEWIPEVEAAMQRQPKAHEAYNRSRLSWTAVQAMWATGRLNDALAYAKTGIDADPLYVASRIQYVTLLAATGSTIGEDFESWDVQALRLSQTRPNGVLWENALAQMIFSGRGDVEAMLNAPVPDAEPFIRDCYRELWSAVKLTAPADRQAAIKKVEPCLLRWDSHHVLVEAASILGDLDMAFAQLDTPEKVNANAFFYYPSWFMPRARALRTDERFLPLMEKLGYVDYWRETKTKPDACSTPEERGIPLCKALE